MSWSGWMIYVVIAGAIIGLLWGAPCATRHPVRTSVRREVTVAGPLRARCARYPRAAIHDPHHTDQHRT